MEPAWEASWAWGLGLTALTIALHAFGIAILIRVVERLSANPKMTRPLRHYPVLLTACLVGFVGLVLAILHGIESGIWALAYLWLGSIGSMRDAIFYTKSLKA